LGRRLVAQLAAEFRFPLVVVARNALGTINHTIQTLMVAEQLGLSVAGVVLNAAGPSLDPSVASNRRELESRLTRPILAEVPWNGTEFAASVDWLALAGDQ
jgi:dethiobiotin synthetase